MSEGGYKQINKTLNAAAFGQYLEAQQAQLPELQDVQQLSQRVIRILGQNPGKFTLQGTNTYLVGTGSTRALIDSGQGVPAWADLVEAELKRRSIRISIVLLTHWHGDHTGGVADLLRLYPHLEGNVYKHTPEPGQKGIRDGDEFAVEGASIRAVHGAGHSKDHVCFVLKEESAMFTGDNVLGHGTTAVEDLGEFVATLEAMYAQGNELGYPGHGRTISNLKLKISRELEVKKRREASCLEALERGTRNSGVTGMTATELVAAIYGHANVCESTEILQPFTNEILRKLAVDGRVAFVMRKGVRRWFTVGGNA